MNESFGIGLSLILFGFMCLLIGSDDDSRRRRRRGRRIEELREELERLERRQRIEDAMAAETSS